MGLTKERERLLISRIQKDDDEQALKELYYSCHGKSNSYVAPSSNILWSYMTARTGSRRP